MNGASWISVALSSAVLIVVLWVDVGRQIRRHFRMRFPFDAYFQVGKEEPDSTRTELRMTAQSTEHMELRIVPNLHYVENEIAIGIGGDEAKRPTISKMQSRFIKRGLNMNRSPDNTDTHYIDYKD